MYQAELRRGVNGSGKTIFCLFILDGTKTIHIHRFSTKAEAIAFHRCGTAYGPLDDQS